MKDSAAVLFPASNIFLQEDDLFAHKLIWQIYPVSHTANPSSLHGSTNQTALFGIHRATNPFIPFRLARTRAEYVDLSVVIIFINVEL